MDVNISDTFDLMAARRVLPIGISQNTVSMQHVYADMSVFLTVDHLGDTDNARKIRHSFSGIIIAY